MPDQALVSAEAEDDHSSLVSRRETAVGSGLRTKEEGGGCVRWWDVGEDVIADALEMSDGLCPLPAHRGFAYVAPLLKLPFSCDCLGADIRVGPYASVEFGRSWFHRPLADAYRAVWTGRVLDRRSKLSNGMRAVWTLLLAERVNLIYPAPVQLPPAPSHVVDCGGFVRAAGRTARCHRQRQRAADAVQRHARTGLLPRRARRSASADQGVDRGGRDREGRRGAGAGAAIVTAQLCTGRVAWSFRFEEVSGEAEANVGAGRSRPAQVRVVRPAVQARQPEPSAVPQPTVQRIGACQAPAPRLAAEIVLSATRSMKVTHISGPSTCGPLRSSGW